MQDGHSQFCKANDALRNQADSSKQAWRALGLDLSLNSLDHQGPKLQDFVYYSEA